MLARLLGPLRTPPMPAARRGARCPVPAARCPPPPAPPLARDRGQPELSHPGTEALARSLTRSAPAAPRRTPVRPGDAARPPPPSPFLPLPPRASHGPRCAPAADCPAQGSPRTARALGVAAAWNSRAAAPAWLSGPTGAKGLSALQPRAARLTPSTPPCVRPSLPLPAEAGGACGSRRCCVRINRAPPPRGRAFLRGGGAWLGLLQPASASSPCTPEGGRAPWKHRCTRASTLRC